MKREPVKTEKRDQQVNVMLSRTERERFDAWRTRKGLDVSSACRFLLFTALDAEEER